MRCILQWGMGHSEGGLLMVRQSLFPYFGFLLPLPLYFRLWFKIATDLLFVLIQSFLIMQWVSKPKNMKDEFKKLNHSVKIAIQFKITKEGVGFFSYLAQIRLSTCLNFQSHPTVSLKIYSRFSILLWNSRDFSRMMDWGPPRGDADNWILILSRSLIIVNLIQMN